MNKEEIEELKEFTIDLTDIDELALGLEVCSKKSNMVIQEFAKLIIELEQQNQKYKEVIDKAIDLIEKSVITDIGIDSNNNIIHYHQLTEDETDELLDILKEVE